MKLDALFILRSVAIVGATQDTRRAGGQPLHSLTHLGYSGKVFAVNPRYAAIEGRPCFASVDVLSEVEINPLFACVSGVLAADAVVRRA
jgi:acetyltransferase